MTRFSSIRRHLNHRIVMKGAALIGIIAACTAPESAKQAPSTSTKVRPCADDGIGDEGWHSDIDAMLSEISSANIRASVDTLAGFGTRNTLSDTTSTTRGIGAARNWIKAQLDDIATASGRTGNEAMQVNFESFMFGGPNGVTTPALNGVVLPRPVEIVNVMAILPGYSPTASSRRYYFTAHYDSRATDVFDDTSDAPGANDNASSVAVLLELARVMSTRKFDATIAFLAVSGEEQALIGSRLHAQAAKQAGIDVRGVINNDIIGEPFSTTGAPLDRQIRVFSEGIPLAAATVADFRVVRGFSLENDSASRNLARYATDVARWQKTDISPLVEYRVDRARRSSDHIGFNEMGFTAMRFTTVDENWDHQHQNVRIEDGVQFGDLASYVDADFTARVGRLNAAVLAHMSNAPESPKNAMFLGELSHNIRVSWDAAADADIAGYELVWRDTACPKWQHVMDVGNVTSMTLTNFPENRDNVFFGVRSYDTDGYRSPVVTLKRNDCTLFPENDGGPPNVCR